MVSVSEDKNDVVLFERKGKNGIVGVLTLNRPEVLNAIDFRVGDLILEKLVEVRRDDTIRALVITGNGRAFSSGGDVGAMKQSCNEGKPAIFMHNLIHMLNQIVSELRDIRKPIIASIPGVTSGGGLDLALACDIRICSNYGKFKAAYTGIGLIPAGGGSFLLSSVIGPAQALEFFLMNDMISADEALRLGLVNKIVPSENLMDYVMNLAEELASGATKAYGNTKYLLNEFIGGKGIEHHLTKEATIQADILVETDDFKEGIRAFLEHRKPQFRGK